MRKKNNLVIIRVTRIPNDNLFHLWIGRRLFLDLRKMLIFKCVKDVTEEKKGVSTEFFGAYGYQYCKLGIIDTRKVIAKIGRRDMVGQANRSYKRNVGEL